MIALSHPLPLSPPTSDHSASPSRHPSDYPLLQADKGDKTVKDLVQLLFDTSLLASGFSLDVSSPMSLRLQLPAAWAPQLPCHLTASMPTPATSSCRP